MSVLDYGDIIYMHASAWLYSVQQGSGTYGCIWVTEKP